MEMPDEIWVHPDDVGVMTIGTHRVKYVRAPQWQTIESAPRDGTGFIGYEAVGREQKVISACVFQNGEFVYINFGYGEDTEADPTHWMPLPAPPEVG